MFQAFKDCYCPVVDVFAAYAAYAAYAAIVLEVIGRLLPTARQGRAKSRSRPG